jgi:magnesium transporter
VTAAISATAIENEYVRRHPAEAAEQIDALPARALAGAAANIDAGALAAAMEYLSPPKAIALFDVLEPQRQHQLLELAAPRVAITLLAELDREARDSMLARLRPLVRDDLNRLLAFPEHTAGRLMERSFVAARATMTVGESLKRLQESSVRRARSLFVTTTDNRLAGRVDVQDLALASRDEPLRNYLQTVEGVVSPLASREEIVDVLDRTRLDSIPVVDDEGRLMGVVRYRSLFRAIEAVASADLQKMVGVSADERALSTAGFAIGRRLPWLHVNLITAFLAASVVGLFEHTIAQFTALAILMPVVAGESGNAGAQALAVTIRGLALKEIGMRQWYRLFRKELVVGVTNGAILAVICGFGVYVWSGSPGLGMIIAAAMVMSLTVATVSGALVPILLTRLGQDPATASSILLTTVTDVFGFFSFLGTATLLSFML